MMKSLSLRSVTKQERMPDATTAIRQCTQFSHCIVKKGKEVKYKNKKSKSKMPLFTDDILVYV